jgi:hypothetical protein
MGLVINGVDLESADAHYYGYGQADSEYLTEHTPAPMS